MDHTLSPTPSIHHNHTSSPTTFSPSHLEVKFGVLCCALQYGDVLFQVANHTATGGDASVHYTLVFNAFVMMQVRLVLKRLATTSVDACCMLQNDA